MKTYIAPENLFTHTIDGTVWQYYNFGKGKKTLVILLNILVFPQEWEYFVKTFANDYRIIIPIYPSISDINIMVQSMHSLLAFLDGNKITLLGNSIGGIISQEYVRLYPENVEKLILLTTIAPSRLYGFLASILYMIGSISPSFFVTGFVFLGTWASLSRNNTGGGNMLRILKHHIARVHTKSYTLALGKCIIDFCLYFPRSFPVSIPLTVIDGQGDIVFPFFARNLHALYPQADYFVIEEGKHLPEINKKQEIMTILASKLINT